MKILMDIIGRGVNSTVTLYENLLKSKLGKIRTFGMKLSQTVRKKLQGIIHFAFGKPVSLKDYFNAGEWYVSKQFIVRIAVVIFIAVILIWYFLIPFLSGKLWTGRMTVNTQEHHEFSGKGEVYNSDGSLLYAGLLEEGDASGSGEVYESENLIYKGDFQGNEYEGQGALYTRDGRLLYKGDFADSLYEGTGVLYYENGGIRFTGEFEQGKFKEGIEYYTNGNRKYSGKYEDGLFSGQAALYSSRNSDQALYIGTFAAGKYNGSGKLYYNGSLLYEGNFLEGEYEGEGKLYGEDEALIYHGQFHAGLYEGEGKLYSEEAVIGGIGFEETGIEEVSSGEFDIEATSGEEAVSGEADGAVSGILIYNGGFKAGLYDGEGRLYSEDGEILIYKGGFKEGLYDGEGELYGEEGNLIYKGGFKEGLYDGEGKLYDEETGRAVYEGKFVNGTYADAGILYGDRGEPLFEGRFFEGVVDYLSYCSADRTEVEEAFGTCDTEEELTGGFLAVYNTLQVMFEFGFVEGENEVPSVNRIRLYGDQEINGCMTGMSLAEFEEMLAAENAVYAKYFFTAGSDEAVMSGYIPYDISEGDTIYCIKYIFDSYFIRAYADSEYGEIWYYEIGGV